MAVIERDAARLDTPGSEEMVVPDYEQWTLLNCPSDVRRDIVLKILKDACPLRS